MVVFVFKCSVGVSVYFKMYYVILVELSECTTFFLSNKERERERKIMNRTLSSAGPGIVIAVNGFILVCVLTLVSWCLLLKCARIAALSAFF